MIISLLLVAAVVGIVGFGVALAVRSKQEFAEQNVVVPGRKSPAPASWAGAHSREARLHRRLGDAVKGAHANPRFAELGLTAQMTAIENEALAIDERLVAAASLPKAHRDAAIDPLETAVDEFEATISEMVTSLTVADTRSQLDAAASEADLGLQALADARAEVEQIDRAASTTGLEPLAPPAPPAPPTAPTADLGEPDTLPAPEQGTASG